MYITIILEQVPTSFGTRRACFCDFCDEIVMCATKIVPPNVFQLIFCSEIEYLVLLTNIYEYLSTYDGYSDHLGT